MSENPPQAPQPPSWPAPPPQQPASQQPQQPWPAPQQQSWPAPPQQQSWPAPPQQYPAPPRYPVAPGPYLRQPYATSPPAQHPAPDAAPQKLGFIALIVAAAAVLLSSVAGGLAGTRIGPAFLQAADNSGPGGALDPAYFSPVREFVLLGEIAFWAGTIAGLTALVLGIVAIVQRRGRGAAIWAIVLSVLGPIVFFAVLLLSMALGYVATP